ncbi:MAG: immunoglobulin domain-containing protein [Verrucomicrobiae bacterium]|nr:immunoglobulin domain-containing protein [Verrucomicrobiae bacterium]
MNASNSLPGRSSGRPGHSPGWLALTISATLLVGGVEPSPSAVQVIGTQYNQDRLFPEFNCYYSHRNYPNCPTAFRAGATAFVYVRNPGPGSVTISDATLAGYSLQTVIKKSTASWNPKEQNSIFFYWDNPPQDIIDAGEPVWWKADPPTVPVNGVAQVAIRLRQVPTNPIRFGVVTSAGTLHTNLTVDAAAPRILSIGYSEDLRKVFIHWRREGGAAPVSVWLNGSNVTALTSTVGDPALNFAASVISLGAPLPYFSYNVYQGVYADGKTATAGQRAWTNKFTYFTWSTFQETGSYDAADWLNEAAAHGFNNVEMNLGAMGGYMGTSAGRNHMLSKGYGYTILDKTKLNPIDPDFWFLNDEPDAEENNQGQTHCGTGLRLPCDSWRWAGTLVMKEAVRFTAELRALRPNVPITVNLNGGLQPQSFYTWGPAVDSLESDNYYEPRLWDAWYNAPQRLPLHNKPKLSYAIARTATEGGAPHPFRQILYANESTDPVWPYPFPESKRMEAYYSLAGGSKGLGYWWFNPPRGLYAASRAPALWREMGLLGHEIKAARNLIVISTPVDLPLLTSTNVWARAVAAGTDTLILYVVNDNYANTLTGCQITNTPNATVTVPLPAWMQPAPMAFEITCGGIYPVNTQLDGTQLQVNLGTLRTTRMIVLTMNPEWLPAVQRRYETQCRPDLQTFAPDVTTNIPLNIVQHPLNRVVPPGGSTWFNVMAFGSGLRYQWQKNGANLADGGHYSGSTNAVLYVSNADASDLASYRCVVATSYATNISNAATLSLTTNPPATPLALPASDVGTNQFRANWTAAADATGYRLDVSTSSDFSSFLPGYQNLDVGNTLSRLVSGLTPGGTYHYRVRAYNHLGNSGESATISVTLGTPVVCPPVGLVNAGFEGGHTGGVADGWTGYQRPPFPTTVWSIQTANPPEPTSTQYQQIANTSSTGGGGVRQNITGCVPGATYIISGWMRGNSQAYATCRVKVSPTASTNWATAVDLNPPAVYTGDTWTAFSGSVVAASTNMTLWLDGQTTGTNQNKAECFDSISISCVLTGAPPFLTQQPADQAIAVGSNAVFNLQAVGATPLSFRWQKGASNLTDSARFFGSSSPTLMIVGANLADAGNYRCIVSNAFGNVTSRVALLTVTNLALPPVFIQQPTDQSAVLGGNATFSVAVEGNPPLAYQWQQNGINLIEGGRFSGVQSSTLTITGVTATDFAQYRCVVSNPYGTNVSLPALLIELVLNPCFGLDNAGFEGAFTLQGGGYIANGWLEWEADPGVVTGYDETALVHNGAHAQRIRIWGGTNGSSGGVYQRVPWSAGEPYLVSAWTYSGDALTTCALGVDPLGGTNAADAFVQWTAGSTNVAWVQQTLSGIAGADFITVFLRVSTTDNGKRNGYFDDLHPVAGTSVLSLLAQRVGELLELSWPGCRPARLEMATNLTPPVFWQTVTNEPLASGGRQSVTLPLSSSAAFFRLVAE